MSQISDLENLLNSINFDSDSHIENLIEEFSDITILEEIEDIWEDDGKYFYGTMIYLIEYKNVKYVVECSQTKSGSYFSGYYYQDAQIDDIIIATEYFAPKEKYSFTFRKENVIILDNDTVKVNDTSFNTVEDAIEFILING